MHGETLKFISTFYICWVFETSGCGWVRTSRYCLWSWRLYIQSSRSLRNVEGHSLKDTTSRPRRLSSFMHAV